MKVKRGSVCQTCRTRKIGCDGKRPGCSQCVLTGRKCDGYPPEWRFISQNARCPNPPKQKQKRGQVPTQNEAQGELLHTSSTASSISKTREQPLSSPIDKANRDELIALIVRAYVPEDEMPYMSNNSDNKQSRICGAWVEALPELSSQTEPDSILSVAIKALASSLMGNTPQEEGEVLHHAQDYHRAIKALRKSLYSTSHPSHSELAAAIMCLSLTELMLPDSAYGISAHIKGVGRLIQTTGPDQYKSGILHKLFVGFRPLLITRACQARQATFLAPDEWTNIPFSIFKPSHIQSLFGQVAIVPTLLQQVDQLLAQNPHDSRDLEAKRILYAFVDTLSNLEKWETLLQGDSDVPGYSICTGDYPSPRPALSKDNDIVIWFPNVTMANVYTHLWTFRIVCLTEAEKIRALLPRHALEEDSMLLRQFQPALVQEKVLWLSSLICSSMEYLMQDGMKLYGPASTFLPLQTAYHAFSMSESQEPNISRIKTIVDRLVGRGLRAAPFIIFGEGMMTTWVE
ncbi:hypothetical protein GX51_04041 [Blastomyces parvus]|uniref:Zn(2)-C6 fungal-type domain-containing protein n=1 Tax=Blastomyces parvus TaxID=2060905 RepID=A0A2B7X3Y6_9EURO|nr:hypothetical protein GX51_04041 [Blastomyces parvus]